MAAAAKASRWPARSRRSQWERGRAGNPSSVLSLDLFATKRPCRAGCEALIQTQIRRDVIRHRLRSKNTAEPLSRLSVDTGMNPVDGSFAARAKGMIAVQRRWYAVDLFLPRGDERIQGAGGRRSGASCPPLLLYAHGPMNGSPL
jgi:hypothetical protein